jgi:hypothetical protein
MGLELARRDPHWISSTMLRNDGPLWRLVVLWTAGVGLTPNRLWDAAAKLMPGVHLVERVTLQDYDA